MSMARICPLVVAEAFILIAGPSGVKNNSTISCKVDWLHLGFLMDTAACSSDRSACCDLGDGVSVSTGGTVNGFVQYLYQ